MVTVAASPQKKRGHFLLPSIGGKNKRRESKPRSFQEKVESMNGWNKGGGRLPILT